MERELWSPLYRTIREVAKDFRQKYVSYQPSVLVAVFLWAALHDRPVAWACQRRHWSTTKLQPARLPHRTTVGRRIDRLTTGAFLREVERRLRDRQQVGLLALLDGKPLLVSGVSKDRDARPGRAAGGKGKGYKLHTLWANRALPEAWEVTPLNEAETTVAQRLLRQAPGAGYVLADGNYDASPVFDAAAASGYQLVTSMPDANAGQGHHYVSPHRKRCIDLMRGEFGRSLHKLRRQIEALYGNAVSFGGGLGPPPAWVRGQDRVRTWVWAKLLINATRILMERGLTFKDAQCC
jgi:DDE family transposase